MPTRVRLAAGNEEWTVEITQSAVRLAGVDEELAVTRGRDGQITVQAASGVVRGAAVRHGDQVWVTIAGRVEVFTVGRRHRQQSAADRDALTVPMPATVVRIAVRPDQPVRQGELLVSLEAMKMELGIRAPRDGVVRAVHCREGELVPTGKVLVDISET